MEILLTGFTAFLTQEWIETAFPDDHVLTTHAKGEALLDTRIKTVMLESKQLLDQLTETYQFDRVVYFSEYLLPHGDQEGELDRLRRVLQSCREREVELLYLSGPEAALTPSSGKTLLANAAEELCFHYFVPVMLLVPLWGPLCVLLLHTSNRLTGGCLREQTLEKLRINEEIHKNILVMENEGEDTVVPLEEALLVNSPAQKRKCRT